MLISEVALESASLGSGGFFRKGTLDRRNNLCEELERRQHSVRVPVDQICDVSKQKLESLLAVEVFDS